MSRCPHGADVGEPAQIGMCPRRKLCECSNAITRWLTRSTQPSVDGDAAEPHELAWWERHGDL